MPRIMRVLLDHTQKHGENWAPSWPTLGSSKVFADVGGEGVGPGIVGTVATVGSIYSPHIRSDGATHISTALMGSPKVFCEGLPVHRDGDLLSCGDVAGGISLVPTKVFVDGGGGGGAAATEDTNQTTGYAIQPLVVDYKVTTLNLPYFLEEEHIGSETYRACEVEFVPEIYTPLIEESTGKEFKNFADVGAQDLPSYAPKHFKDPIKITSLELLGRLPGGLQFDSSTGVIKGKLHRNWVDLEGFLAKFKVKAINEYNMESTTGSMRFRPVENPNC